MAQLPARARPVLRADTPLFVKTCKPSVRVCSQDVRTFTVQENMPKQPKVCYRTRLSSERLVVDSVYWSGCFNFRGRGTTPRLLQRRRFLQWMGLTRICDKIVHKDVSGLMIWLGARSDMRMFDCRTFDPQQIEGSCKRHRLFGCRNIRNKCGT